MKSFLRRLMATALAKAKGSFPGTKRRWLGKRVRDGRQDQTQIETAEPPCDRGPVAGPASLVSLCHGSDHPADSPAVRRRGVVLERGRSLQYLADASGPGGQEGRRFRRRYPPRVLHHYRD